MFKCKCRNVSVQVQVWKCQCVSVSVEVSVFKRFSGRILRNAFGKKDHLHNKVGDPERIVSSLGSLETAQFPSLLAESVTATPKRRERIPESSF